MGADGHALGGSADGDALHGTERGAGGVDVDLGDVIAAAVGDHGDGREITISELVGNSHGAWRGGSGTASQAHVYGLDDEEIRGVGLEAIAGDRHGEMMGQG